MKPHSADTHPIERLAKVRAKQVAAVNDNDEEREAIQAEPPKRPPLPSLRDRVLALGHKGPRYAIGIPTFDGAVRGGVVPSARIVLVGAPGACKSTLISQSAATCAENPEMFVAVHVCDEEAAAVVLRIALRCNFKLSKLEAADDEEKALAAEYLERRYPNLLIVDQDADGWTLNDTIDEATERAAGRQIVLAIDSAQGALIRNTDPRWGERERIGAIVRLIKVATTTTGAIAIYSSEMNRGGYRSRNGQENVEDLATGAESRSLEYQATVLVALRSVKGGHGTLIDASIGKNRLGKAGTKFRLELDPERASLTEVEMPEEDRIDDGERRAADDRKRVLDAVDADPWLNFTKLKTAAGMDSNRLDAALAPLKTAGAIVERPGAKKNIRLFATAADAATGPDGEHG